MHAVAAAIPLECRIGSHPRLGGLQLPSCDTSFLFPESHLGMPSFVSEAALRSVPRGADHARWQSQSNCRDRCVPTCNLGTRKEAERRGAQAPPNFDIRVFPLRHSAIVNLNNPDAGAVVHTREECGVRARRKRRGYSRLEVVRRGEASGS
jgi:hypothetical protein